MITNDKGVIIASIEDDGVFVNSALKVGMQVKTVNNVEVSTSAEAVALLKKSTGQITIVAEEVKTVPEQTPAASVMGSTARTSPPGVATGGQWGTNKYVGSNTQALACLGCLCFCLPGLCVLMCPVDDRDVYKSTDNNVYDAAGRCLGKSSPAGGVSFVPKRNDMKR